MITAQNEFETIPPFEHIAGCNIGSCTDRETTVEMIEVLATVSHCDTDCYWKELAQLDDDDIPNMIDIQEEIADDINNNAPLPPYCFVSRDDNEWRVLPYLDTAVTRVGIMPGEFTEEELIFVNDHGNATLYCWGQAAQEYIEQWTTV